VDAASTAGLERLRKKPERKANSARDGLAGAKARLILLTLSARLNRLLRNSPNAIIFWRFEAAGAKALAHFAPLTARLKPCPCYKTQFQQSFVTACKAVRLLQNPVPAEFRNSL
jgi:hypothetical protein